MVPDIDMDGFSFTIATFIDVLIIYSIVKTVRFQYHGTTYIDSLTHTCIQHKNRHTEFDWNLRFYTKHTQLSTINILKHKQLSINCLRLLLLSLYHRHFLIKKLKCKSTVLKVHSVKLLKKKIYNVMNPFTPTDLYGMFQIKAWIVPF